MTIDLDHTSFAVPDALDWGRSLRRELGAVPVAGSTNREFRYLLMYVGSADAGARIELIDPTGPGFVTRFLDSRGEGPHHLTFKVPSLVDAVAQARSTGLTVVGEDQSNPLWREAFIAPDGVHGTVVQLAQTTIEYPSPAELLATRDRSWFPESSGWWAPVWDVEPCRSARLGATNLVSTDLGLSRRLFGGVLGGSVAELSSGLRFEWPSGCVVVRRGAEPGVIGMVVEDGPAEGLRIGRALLGTFGATP